MHFHIKKRVVLALIITAIVTFITNRYWISFIPLDAAMNIAGTGKANIEIQLNKKNDNNFERIKKDRKSLTLGKEKKLAFDVKRARNPKRLKFVFSVDTLAPLTISNIQFANGKYKIDDLGNFTAVNADINIVNNSIVLAPNKYDFELIYNNKLTAHSEVKFSYEIFIIILSLTFLLAYKVSDYIADFKSVQNKSRVDIIFLTIFFISLFIPMINIDDSDVSEQENRVLATWKPLFFDEETINFQFGRNFNDWFNDRFNQRQLLLDIYNIKLLLYKNWRTNDVIKGKDNWFFLGHRDSIDSYTNRVMFTADELKKLDTTLDEINEYCRLHNKKFYFFIAPDKARIYSEYYHDAIMQKSKTPRAIQLVNYINDHSKVNVVYPKDYLISKKGKDLLYWKHDTHWNKLGAYWGYIALMEKIKQDYPNIKVYVPDKYEDNQMTGDLYNMAPKLLRHLDETLYHEPAVNGKAICNIPDALEDQKADVDCYNANSNINMLMFRDSFTVNMIPYLAYTFGKSKYIWKFEISLKYMENADVVILEVAERALPLLLDMKLEVK